MINGDLVENIPSLKKVRRYELTSDYISHDVKTGKKRAPKRVGFPNEYRFRTKDGDYMHVIYFTARVPVKNKNGETDYMYLVDGQPEVEFFAGVHMVHPNKPDLAMFFDMAPWNASSENRDENIIAKIKLINEEEIHKKRVEESEEIFEATQYLHDPVRKLTTEQLRDILRSYNEVGRIDEMSDREVRSRLLSYINGTAKSSQSGARNFMKRLDSPDLRVRIIVKKAIEQSVLRFEEGNRDWLWNIPGSLNGQAIYRVPRGLDPFASFVRWLQEKDETGTLHHITDNLVDGGAKAQEEFEDEIESEANDKIALMRKGKKLNAEVKDLNRQGDTEYAKGNYEAAINLYNESIEKNPADTDARKTALRYSQDAIDKCNKQLEKLAAG